MTHLLRCCFFLLMGLAALLGAPARAASLTSQVAGVGCLTNTDVANKVAGFQPCQTGLASQILQFTNLGTIRVSSLGALCLTTPSDTAEPQVGMAARFGTCLLEKSFWKRDGNRLKHVRSGLCMAASAPIRLLQLTFAPCSQDANQQWTFSADTPFNWPATAADPRASSKVPLTRITKAVLSQTVQWMQAETSIGKTDFCWKKADYFRSGGKLPTKCRAGMTFDTGFCYDPDPPGYTCKLKTCSSNCPNGYNSSGPLTCVVHSYPKASYLQKTGGGCVDSRFRCLGLCYDREDNSNAHCRAGYSMTDSHCGTCIGNGPTSVTRTSRDRSGGVSPQSCSSDWVKENGFCNERPRDGYSCTALTCTQQCASGSIPCGAGCAQNVGTCTTAVTDMVVSPALMVANLVSLGTMGPVAKGVVVASAKLAEAIKEGRDAAELAMIMKDSLENYMAQAEHNLAEISTPVVEQTIAGKYGRGTPDYRQIAREYALLSLIAAIRDSLVQLELLVITSGDPTFVTDTIVAYAKPPCAQHKAIP